jgi:hypothetical protein
VQALPSLHDVPGAGVCIQSVLASVSVVHGLPSSQVAAHWPPEQIPLAQSKLAVQAVPLLPKPSTSAVARAVPFVPPATRMVPFGSAVAV